MADGTQMTREERRAARAAAKEQTRAPSNTGGNRRGRDDKPDTMRWLNVGAYFTNPDTGEEEFIGLPLGIPIDTQDEARGSSWYSKKKNQLLKMLQGKEMDAGEEVETKLLAVLREVGAPTDTTEEEKGDMPDIF